MLLIHGDGSSIGGLAAQTAFFQTHRKVIVMDSRDQGRSGDSAGPLTYEKVTDDHAALLDHLKTGPADVLGWSGGANQALLMGVRQPGKVKKLVAMAANLRPDANYPEFNEYFANSVTSITANARKTPQGRRQLKLAILGSTEPHIDPALLKQFVAPTLILSGDHEMIRLDDTIAVYEALPNAELAVFPNSTHMAPFDDPQMFNATLERFLTTPFKNKNRIKDFMASYEKLTAGIVN